MVSAAVKRSAARRLPVLLALVVVAAAIALFAYSMRHELRAALGGPGGTGYQTFDPTAPLVPRYDGPDAQRERIAIDLEVLATGIEEPTDIQFPPGVDRYAVVLSKTGVARWLRLDNGAHGELFRESVKNQGEAGLLGLAFHPRFADNGRLFIHYVVDEGGKLLSRVAEWRLTRGEDFPASKAQRVRVLFELEQPYGNHNGGGVAFGPDGYLYIGYGDGGSGGDPHGHGQNGKTLLGTMMRIDVDRTGEGRPYAIPADNPFLGKPDFRPEIWAYGLRNPWRYAWDPQGRLVIADVGQNLWEEIDIARAGDNLGWAIREGFACFAEDRQRCERKDLVDPIFVYGREDGASITGGHVYTGSRIPKLRGLYVFGDFMSGRLHALRLPEDRTQRVSRAITLGQWPVMPASFGRDHRGELYIADFRRGGQVLRVVPPKTGKGGGQR